jgi:hypothetical protein
MTRGAAAPLVAELVSCIRRRTTNRSHRSWLHSGS